MGYHCFRPLRQNDGDTLAALHAKRKQRIAKAIGLLLQVAVGNHCSGAALVLPVKRNARTIL